MKLMCSFWIIFHPPFRFINKLPSPLFDANITLLHWREKSCQGEIIDATSKKGKRASLTFLEL